MTDPHMIPDVKVTREQMGFTQERFAALFGIELSTLKDWEQGRTQPRTAARTLLRVVAANPEMVIQALAQPGMRRYKCHKVVHAGQIQGMIEPPPSLPGEPAFWAVKVNYEEIMVPAAVFARATPEIDDYLVQYEDGYLSWSPKGVFEDGYTLLDRDVPRRQRAPKVPRKKDGDHGEPEDDGPVDG